MTSCFCRDKCDLRWPPMKREDMQPKLLAIRGDPKRKGRGLARSSAGVYVSGRKDSSTWVFRPPLRLLHPHQQPHASLWQHPASWVEIGTRVTGSDLPLKPWHTTSTTDGKCILGGPTLPSKCFVQTGGTMATPQSVNVCTCACACVLLPTILLVSMCNTSCFF